MSTSPEARAWIRVSADALRRNYARIRASVGPATSIIPMVKADAYGLGMREVVGTLKRERPWGWGVATLAEGVRLRELGIEDPVIVLCPLPPESLAPALAARLQVTVSSLESLESLIGVARTAQVVPAVHVDVDTGMGRSGFDWRGAREWMPRIVEAARADIRWVGCFTHLHSADEDEASGREQWGRLRLVLDAVGEVPPGLMVHVLNSAGALRLPELANAAVRPGIFLYGGQAGRGLPAPEPVASVHARVIHLRHADPGTTLGYGATHRARGPERWATLSIGYGDGLPRGLGNRGQALIHGRRVGIIGRISMDMTVVDISGVSGVRVGDFATLLGTEGEESITVDDVAELAGTISYEILTGFTPRLPRVWTGLDGS
jgi:alanine racemase